MRTIINYEFDAKELGKMMDVLNYLELILDKDLVPMNKCFGDVLELKKIQTAFEVIDFLTNDVVLKEIN